MQLNYYKMIKTNYTYNNFKQTIFDTEEIKAKAINLNHIKEKNIC